MSHPIRKALCWIPISPPVSAEIDLPPSSENLFGRIIRKPLPPNRPPRERECTEMFAAVVSLAPRIRDALLDWWLEDELGSGRQEELLFDVETEGAVPGGKRYDLRIEGRSQDDEPRFLIIVEVKVGSRFHWSPAVDAERGAEDGAGVEVELRHQIVHYDRWLASEPHPARRGVVLAPTDLTEELPPGLRTPWRCITWGEVGRRVADLVLSEELPPNERFLVRHLVGFIQDHLGDITVKRNELAFEDVALLRAVARMGRDLTRRVDALVEQVAPLFEEVGIGVGETKKQKNLLSGVMRAIAWRYLDSGDSLLSASAGVVTEGGVDLILWIESKPKYPAKAEIQKIIEKHLPAFEAADPRWRLPEEGPRSAAWDLEIRYPLEHLLTADDQFGVLQNFVRGALEQLRDSGLIHEIKEALAARGSES